MPEPEPSPPPPRPEKLVRPEIRRWFYVVVAFIVFCIIAILALSLRWAPISDKDQESTIKVIGWGGGFLAILFLIVRGEQRDTYQHRSAEKIEEKQDAAVVAATEAKASAAEAKITAEHLPEAVVKKLNGGVEKAAKEAVAKALDASPFPTTHEELRKFIAESRGELCGQIALEAVEKTVPRVIEKMKECGWKAPA